MKGRTVARLTRDNLPVGDPLTDSREDDDDYPFHDVFHVSYAVHPRWSPTPRRPSRMNVRAISELMG